MQPDQRTVDEIGPIWRELHGGLWHTTQPERFARIMDTGAISNEPKGIANSDRWSTSQGRKHYPYVRFIGGISLFDFSKFNPQRYETKYPLSNWRYFVPYRNEWGGAIWIEIDREKAKNGLISGHDLLIKWKEEECFGHRIMPLIEAAHIGPLPVTAFRRAIVIASVDNQFQELDLPRL